MTSDPAAVHAFASLRFAGDGLNPDEVSDVVRVEPTLAYRKGERYPIGAERDGVGQTGVWMVSTEGRFPEHDLRPHLEAVAHLIAIDPKHPARDERVTTLRDMVERRGLTPVVTVFWHGPPGARLPTIQTWFKELVGRINGEVDEDFYRPDAEPTRRPSVPA
jgi:hypothetical protein